MTSASRPCSLSAMNPATATQTPSEGGETAMRTMTRPDRTGTSVRPRVCTYCRATGQDPNPPRRHTSNGELIYLVRACPECEGHATLPPMGHRDLSRT